MKTIVLKSNGLGRYDEVSPFIITNGKLELKVALPAFNGEFFFIAENNGTSFKQVISESGVVVLDSLTAGELKAEVKHYLKGNLIQSFKIEPLILRAVDCSLSGTPEVVELAQSLNDLKQALEEQKRAFSAKFAALLRFAYTDYHNNVFLSGGSLSEFIKEFRIELTEEEIKEIFSKE